MKMSAVFQVVFSNFGFSLYSAYVGLTTTGVEVNYYYVNPNRNTYVFT